MLKFDACVGGCEVPVGLGVVGVAVVFPGGDFLYGGLFVGNAAVEALGGEDAQFRLRQIEPTAVFWGIAPFEAFDQPPGFGGRASFGIHFDDEDVQVFSLMGKTDAVI